MIEMGVRDNHTAHALLVLLEKGRVRERIVGARCVVFFFKVESHIKDKNVAINIDRDHVSTDFFNAAEGNNADNIGGRFFWIVIRTFHRDARHG